MSYSNRCRLRFATAAVVVAFCFPHWASAQESVRDAVQEAREAWLAHDVERLVSGSDTVRLRIPGIPPSPSLRPSQAARLLEQYLKSADEQSFTLRDIREIDVDHAYAEIRRVYAIRGTVEEREETVFLGFRVIDGQWRLREVRVAP